LNHTDDAFEPVAQARDVVVRRAGLRMNLPATEYTRAAPKGAFDRTIADTSA
jgi:hypothetical protein